jgi:hypothetical protein
LFTGSVDFGTAGECFTSWITGGTFVVATELRAPGVAPRPALDGAQFWPLSLLNAALRSSIDFPAPFAGVVHAQPLNVPFPDANSPITLARIMNVVDFFECARGQPRLG